MPDTIPKTTWQALIERSIQVKVRTQSRWFAPPLHHIEVKLGDNPQVFQFSGTEEHCATILKLLACTPKTTDPIECDLVFRKGEKQAQSDATMGKSSASPYAIHTAAHLWWTRGYNHAARLFRAIAAEDALRKRQPQNHSLFIDDSTQQG